MSVCFYNRSAIVRRVFPLCLLVICTTGCVIPLPSKTISGHRYTQEEIAFLDLPRTTREDVVSSLGPPWAEVHSPAALLYTWQTEGQFYYVPPPAPDIFDSHSSVEGTKSHNWGLFIALDQTAASPDTKSANWEIKTREKRAKSGR